MSDSQPEPTAADELAAALWASMEAFTPDADCGPEPSGRQPLVFAGGSAIPGLPTRADLVRRGAGGDSLAAKIEETIGRRGLIFFLPTDLTEQTVYSKGVATYTLQLFGCLLNGAKAHVVITDIDVYFDVRERAEVSAHSTDNLLRNLLISKDIKYVRLEAVERYPLQGFQEAPCRWWRVFFPTTQARKLALAAVRDEGYATASDDTTCYWRMAGRNLGLTYNSWAALGNYASWRGSGHPAGEEKYAPPSAHCEYVFRVRAGDITPLVAPIAARADQEVQMATVRKTPLLAKDRTLVMTWDIETLPANKTDGHLPLATIAGDRLVMIAATVHWRDDPTPLLEVVFTSIPSEPDKRWETVLCDGETGICMGWGAFLAGVPPEVLVGFNDHDYDWTFFIETARRLGILGEFLDMVTCLPRRSASTTASAAKWNVQHKKIKIGGGTDDTAEAEFFDAPGFVSVDARTCMRKIFPKDEVGGKKSESLNAYLKLCGLPLKADMPHTVMWEICGADDPRRMRWVAHYCRCDALKCQLLLHKKAVIADCREVGWLSFTSFSDAVFNAGGHKVRNMVAAYATRRGYLCSMIPKERGEKGKYPGAHVYYPKKGLYPDPARLAPLEAARSEVAALRTVLGASGDVGAREDAGAREDVGARGDVGAREDVGTDAPEAAARAEIAALGRSIAKALAGRRAPDAGPRELFAAAVARLPAGLRAEAFEAAAAEIVRWALKAGPYDRPCTGLDFASLYPSLIMAYNLSPETFVESEARAAELMAQGLKLHPVTFEFLGRPVVGWFVRYSAEEHMGVYPFILNELFEKRAAMKKRQAELELIQEHMETLAARIAARGYAAAFADERAALKAQAAELDASADRETVPVVAGLIREDLGRVQKRAAYMDRLVAGPANTKETWNAYFLEVSEEIKDVSTRQKALKVYMNTFYGEAGNADSPLFLLQLAGGVTAAGKYNLLLVGDYVSDEGYRLLYGDSVTGDTPLIVRRGGVISTARIDELSAVDAWAAYGAKEASAVPGLEVWQDGGFTSVTRLIRHRCNKPIRRVLTHTGVVDCTEDHSLLRPDGAEVRPGACRVGEHLLHAADGQLISELDACDSEAVDGTEAYAMGLFAADGSCGTYGTGVKTKHSWAINNKDLALLRRAATCLPFPTRILDTLASSGVYKLVPVGNIVGPTRRYRAMFYNDHREKRVPPEILGGSAEVAEGFWFGFYASKDLHPPGRDGSRAEQARQIIWRFDQKGKEMVAGLWLLARRLGWRVSINDRAGKPDIFRLTCSDEGGPALRRPPTAIKKIYGLPPVEYVYDLETCSHHFHVGPGDLVVHNTDSVYVSCPENVFTEADAAYVMGARPGGGKPGTYDREAYWTDLVLVTMRELAGLRNRVNARLRDDNGTRFLRMAYEEVLYPFGLFGKKKYFGVAHVRLPNFHPKKLFIRGIDIVKVGQTALAKEIGFRILWASAALDNTRGFSQIVEDTVREAITNHAQWNFTDFVMTASWKPLKDNKSVHTFVARMKARICREASESAGAPGTKAPGTKLPTPGARFSYVLTQSEELFTLSGKKRDAKIGDMMEYPEAARARGLQLAIGQYLTRYVAGLCARFLSPELRFQPPPGTDDDTADKFATKAAKKFLIQFVTEIQTFPREVVAARGYAYKRAWKAATAAAREDLCATHAEAVGIIDGALVWSDFLGGEDPDGTPPPSGEIVSSLVALAAAAGAAVGQGGRPAALARELGIGADGSDTDTPEGARPAATRLFTALSHNTWGHSARGQPRPLRFYVLRALDRLEAGARDELAGRAALAVRVAIRYRVSLAALVEQARAAEHAQHPDTLGAAAAADAPGGGAFALSDVEMAGLKSLQAAWTALVGVYAARAAHAGFVEHLEGLKARRLRSPRPPCRAESQNAIAARALVLPPLGLAPELPGPR